MSNETLYRRGNDECATPDWIRKGMFGDWYDPCPLSQSLIEKDGLNSDWPGKRAFVNPPYSKLLPWVEKAIAESKKGKTIVLLVRHDSSTVWYARFQGNSIFFELLIIFLRCTRVSIIKRD